jgi:hypothetical protein
MVSVIVSLFSFLLILTHNHSIPFLMIFAARPRSRRATSRGTRARLLLTAGRAKLIPIRAFASCAFSMAIMPGTILFSASRPSVIVSVGANPKSHRGTSAISIRRGHSIPPIDPFPLPSAAR